MRRYCAVNADTVCSTPAASQMPAGSVMFDSHATVHETMRRRDKDLAAQHVPFYLLTTPSRPIVIEVVLSCVEYLQHRQGLLSLR